MNEMTIEDGSTELQSSPNSKQSTNIYSRFKHAFLSPSTQMEPLTIELHSSKATQTLNTPTIRKQLTNNPIFVWRSNGVGGITTQLQLPSVANTNGAGEQRTVRRLRRDKRAATSLFTLVLVFMIFLLPYVFVVVVGRIFSIKILTDTNGQVYSAAFWLLWLNSTVNPILYPFIQPRFREAYRRLFLRFTRRQRRLASLIADLQRGK
jgi:hypothetical protein